MVVLQNRWLGVLLGLVIANTSFAGAAQWSSTNVQYLYGDQYTNVGTNDEVSASILPIRIAVTANLKPDFTGNSHRDSALEKSPARI
jgi:hypothetical protein